MYTMGAVHYVCCTLCLLYTMLYTMLCTMLYTTVHHCTPLYTIVHYCTLKSLPTQTFILTVCILCWSIQLTKKNLLNWIISFLQICSSLKQTTRKNSRKIHVTFKLGLLCYLFPKISLQLKKRITTPTYCFYRIRIVLLVEFFLRFWSKDLQY